MISPHHKIIKSALVANIDLHKDESAWIDATIRTLLDRGYAFTYKNVEFVIQELRLIKIIKKNK